MITAAIESVKSSCKFGGCAETTSKKNFSRKQPTKLGRKLGQAQLMYEKMIRTAERKLSENRRKSLSDGSKREQAEALANELFHKPGTLLAEGEIAQMWSESGCEELRERPSCRFPTVNQFRTVDGSCNNLQKPLLGASGTAFSRLTPPSYEDGISSPRGFLQSQRDFSSIGPFQPPNPSARLVSTSVIEDIRQEEVPFSHLLMQWGQFLDHDFTLSPFQEGVCEGCEVSEVCNPIRVPDGDRAFGKGTLNDGNCLPTQRSLPVCEMDKPLTFSPREQLNELTSFIDGSMIYGSEGEVAVAVRAYRQGLLLTGRNFPGDKPSLPVDEENIVDCPNQRDCFLCGDVRCNEQFSLTIIHTLWLREHNRCAREMARINPHWDDERLYQECRAIVGALIQKITYVDYLPKIFGAPSYHLFVGPYPGYDSDVDPSIPNSFGAAAYRYGHTLIRSQFDRLGANNRPLAIGPLNLADAFFSPDQFRIGLGTDPIVRGWLARNSLRVDEFLNIVLTTRLFKTRIPPGFDLAALNIHRGRDHGLAPYPVWKNFCARVFGQTSEFENDLTLIRFLKLFGSLDTLDLWIGGLAEERLPQSLIGATFACLFGITFQRVRNGDRFWYENPGVFTRGQLAAIRNGTMSRIICDNSDNIERIQPDAFVTNQARRSCSRLPSVDLEQWKEDVCYVRVRVNPRSSRVDVSALTRSVTRKFIFTNVTVRRNNTPQFRCLQVQCPGIRVRTDAIVFSRSRSASITPNSNLPEDLSAAAGVYLARVSSQVGNRPNNGLFSTLGQCQSSSEVALTFNFRKQEVKVQIKEDDEDDTKLPTEVVELLKSESKNMSSTPEAGTANQNEAQDVNIEDSKAQGITIEDLIRELEQAGFLSDSEKE